MSYVFVFGFWQEGTAPPRKLSTAHGAHARMRVCLAAAPRAATTATSLFFVVCGKGERRTRRFICSLAWLALSCAVIVIIIRAKPD
jgi:hypothetical protein